MSRLRIHNFSISLDGYGAGVRQDEQSPLGTRGLELHQWIHATQKFREMYGGEGGSTGVDNDFMRRGFAGIGVWILGRNMFGPDRGPWANDAWRGWWGENPPYHTKVFVITHHSRPPVPMDGGTEFRFVDDIDRALREATEAAGGQDIRLGGGVSVIRQYLQRALVDEMHLAVTPVLLGSGEHLLSGLDLPALGYEVTEHVAGEKATHMVVSKRRG
jgi:dihydrofolate reductase